MSAFALDHPICPQKEKFQASNSALQHSHFCYPHYVAGREQLYNIQLLSADLLGVELPTEDFLIEADVGDF